MQQHPTNNELFFFHVFIEVFVSSPCHGNVSLFGVVVGDGLGRLPWRALVDPVINSNRCAVLRTLASSLHEMYDFPPPYHRDLSILAGCI